VISRLVRCILVGLLALVCLSTFVTADRPGAPSGPDLVPAADTSQFRAGNIISDAVFYDGGSMSAAEVQAFLTAKGKDCTAGEMPCLEDYRQTTATQPSDNLCKGYKGVAKESAAAIIAKVGASCDISPRVLLVLLQKEQSLVTGTKHTKRRYAAATGFSCPDTAACNPAFEGFVSQVYFAARQFQRYRVETWPPYKAGRTNTIAYAPATKEYNNINNWRCGTSQVYIENHATAALYNYTPYRPNKAALAAGSGEGDSCSAYGNRNFWLYFTDWFGSTQVGGRDPDAPVGRLETVRNQGNSVLVRGWAYDPNSPTSAVRLGIIADGQKIGSDTTDVPRPDVAEVNSGAGPNQGFEVKLPLRAGKHTVCVYAANIGAGKTAPRLGCATVTITTLSYFNPKGRTTDVRVAGTRVVVEGWSFDPDSPKSASTVRIYAGGLRLGDVKATADRPTVGKYYPSAGSAHGFSLTSRLTPGRHRVCVYGLNRGLGTENRTSLGCQTVTATGTPVTPPVTSGSPVGRVMSFALDGQDLAFTGWAFDPDAPRSAARVQLVSDGDVLAEMSAKGDWPDVQRAHPYAGSVHKFSWRGIVPAGPQRLCVRAVDVGPGSDRNLTCRSVTVEADPAANPRGVLDALQIADGTVRVSGWSYDPDAPTSSATVRILLDGTKVVDLVANKARPGLSKSHPMHADAGDAHGYVWSGTLPPGVHKICAEAINVKYGTGNTTLRWCRTTPATAAAAVGGSETVEPPVEEATTAEDTAAGTGAAGTAATGTGAPSTPDTDAGPADPVAEPTGSATGQTP
jgi:hypothetical protein